MLSLPTFILDVSPYLLLNTRKNSNMTFFHIKIRAKGWPRRYFEHGETGISLKRPAFPQHRTGLNPHSASAFLTYRVQQGVEADN